MQRVFPRQPSIHGDMTNWKDRLTKILETEI